jgi:hypothetical protein
VCSSDLIFGYSRIQVADEYVFHNPTPKYNPRSRYSSARRSDIRRMTNGSRLQQVPLLTGLLPKTQSRTVPAQHRLPPRRLHSLVQLFVAPYLQATKAHYSLCLEPECWVCEASEQL